VCKKNSALKARVGLRVTEWVVTEGRSQGWGGPEFSEELAQEKHCHIEEKKMETQGSGLTTQGWIKPFAEPSWVRVPRKGLFQKATIYWGKVCLPNVGSGVFTINLERVHTNPEVWGGTLPRLKKSNLQEEGGEDGIVGQSIKR